MWWQWLMSLLGMGRPARGAGPEAAATPGRLGDSRTPEDLAGLLGVDVRTLQSFDVAYHEFQIAKGRGKRGRAGRQAGRQAGGAASDSANRRGSHKLRTIHAPNPKLKALQRTILKRVLGGLRAHDAAMAYERGRSIVTHAERHCDSAVVVGIDLHEFFGNTTTQRVQAYFEAIGWNTPSAAILTRLVTHRGALPQGAPTSPRLANLVNCLMDARLDGMAQSNGARYSRYSDDLAFSFDADDSMAIKRVVNLTSRVVADFGYSIHTKEKLFIRRAHQRQVITGLVVNEGPPRLSRDTRRWLRAVRHRMEHPASPDGLPTLSRGQVQGWEAFERMVEEGA